MSSNVNDSTFSESGKPIVDTHEATEDTLKLIIDASTPGKILYPKATETFFLDGSGLLNPHNNTFKSVDELFPKPEKTENENKIREKIARMNNNNVYYRLQSQVGTHIHAPYQRQLDQKKRKILKRH
jgi:hypothetical protein